MRRGRGNEPQRGLPPPRRRVHWRGQRGRRGRRAVGGRARLSRSEAVPWEGGVWGRGGDGESVRRGFGGPASGVGKQLGGSGHVADPIGAHWITRADGNVGLFLSHMRPVIFFPTQHYTRPRRLVIGAAASHHYVLQGTSCVGHLLYIYPIRFTFSQRTNQARSPTPTPIHTHMETSPCVCVCVCVCVLAILCEATQLTRITLFPRHLRPARSGLRTLHPPANPRCAPVTMLSIYLLQHTSVCFR